VIEGDDTHHIDVAVSSTKTSMTIIETNTEDNNYLPLQDNPKAFTKR
jgi:hypothetical protein